MIELLSNKIPEDKRSDNTSSETETFAVQITVGKSKI